MSKSQNDLNDFIKEEDKIMDHRDLFNKSDKGLK